MKLASSEARKRTALATSTGWPTRPSMCLALAAASQSSVAMPRRSISRSEAEVKMQPGQTELTRMRWGGEVEGHAAGHGGDGAFRGVIGGEVGLGDEGGDGGEVDDGAALFFEKGDGGLGDHGGADDVGVEDAAPVGGGGVFDGEGGEVGGVVDENVELAGDFHSFAG